MKETNRGKQMKSVWTIKPPESWEKKFGKHPTQKPVALLERVLLASTNEGDLVLDPFNGGGTTLVSAFRLRRNAFGCELSLNSIELSVRRICSELAHVSLRLTSFDFSLDLFSQSMDRSDRANVANRLCRARVLRRAGFVNDAAQNLSMPPRLQLVQQERRFYFIGRADRNVLFSVLAPSLEDAHAKFLASGHSASDALFIIKIETEIYLA
jgi:hypothetical protein